MGKTKQIATYAIVVTLLFIAAALVVTAGLERNLVVDIKASSDVSRWDRIWREDQTIPVVEPNGTLPSSLPGQFDIWAGAKNRSVAVKLTAPPGRYYLSLDFYNAHESSPPEIEVTLDGRKVASKRLPKGSGAPPPYDSIDETMRIDVVDLELATGSVLTLTNLDGSWAALARLRVLGEYGLNPSKAGFILLGGFWPGGVILGIILGTLFFLKSQTSGVREGAAVTILVAVSVCVSLALTEGLFRVYTASRTGETHHAIQEDERLAPDVRKPLPAFALPFLVRPTTDPEIPYRLKASLRGNFGRHPITTNSHGMRGFEVAVEKPEGTLRIAGLGDSTLFGWGVAYEDSTMPILGQMIRAIDDRKVELLNFSAPGYNTAVEVAIYHKLARNFAPDIVIMLVIANDFGYPTIMVTHNDMWALDRFYLVDRLQKFFRLGWVDAPESKKRIFTNRDIAIGDEGKLGLMEERVRDYYDKTLGFDRALDYVHELGEMTLGDGAIGVVIYHTNGMIAGKPETYDLYAPKVAAAAEAAGMIGIDMTSVYVEYLKGQDTPYMKDHLWAYEWDAHPNRAAHEMMAREITRRLIKKGVVSDNPK